MLKRTIYQSIINQIKAAVKKAIIIYGARQVGKTTLVKEIKDNYKGRSEYYNCDFLDVQDFFSYEKIQLAFRELESFDLIVLDEAQRIENIGLVLKILVDNLPKLQIIATGSSSFELSNKINEPLTGRKSVFQLYPFSFNELHAGLNTIEQKRVLHNRLIYGNYPQVSLADETDSRAILRELTTSYLFKDIFIFQQLRKPELLMKLLRLLAFQIGSQVSFTELSNKLQVDQTVIQRYLHILEEAFVIFRLGAFKQNLRNEIAKNKKFYFWDLGIRNAIIQNFNPLDMRNDIGALWENFIISERMKVLSNNQKQVNTFFWRTYEQKEIDLIEEDAGKISAYEVKWNISKRTKEPVVFIEAYPDSAFKLITPDNFSEFLI